MYRKKTLEKKVASLQSSLFSRGLPVSRDWIRTKILATPKCTYCGQLIEIQSYSADHIIPLNRKGKNIEANIQLIDVGCNRMKNDLTDEEFRALMGFLSEYPEMYKNVRARLRAGGGFIHGYNKRFVRND